MRRSRPSRLPIPARSLPPLVAAGMLIATGAAAAQTAPLPAGSTQPAATSRTVVSNADQLPRRTYRLEKLPSELLQAPLAEVLALAEPLDRDVAADLAAFDIQDAATLRGMVGTRLSVALLKGDRAAVAALGTQLRALQDKPGPRLTSGISSELMLQAAAEGRDDAARNERLRVLLLERLSPMPWADIEDSIKQAKAGLELANPAVVLGAFQSQLDAAARNAGMNVPAGIVATIVGARAQNERVLPLRAGAVAALNTLIDRQAATTAPRRDVWSERLVALPAEARLHPVHVAIWDSGVDTTLFRALPGGGIAFTDEGLPSPDLLRPLGEMQPRWPQVKKLVQGSWDLRAGLDTPAARELKAAIAALRPEQVKAFQEDLAAASLYTHGTHVAGIAMDGNPFARLFAVSMHFSHRSEPPRPSAERSQRTAANYRAIVRRLQAEGVKVVNMSWRYGPQVYEAMLGFHGVGKDAEERKRMARELFSTERDALREAIASAPGILFVAGSGNEDNSADFAEYIPAGLSLPNLITAGAVDPAGEETNFSTFGRTVVVHANGFEIDSFIPGGERMRFSGTSMAAPQVANLAAKLLAIEPALTPVQLKGLILAHAERRGKDGRVNLINPKATVQALRARGMAAVPAPAAGS